MRYIVTGAAGFVGANLVAALNERGEKDIIVVDQLRDCHKYRNLVDLEITDYLDQDEFLAKFRGGFLGQIAGVLHEGACSDTMEMDGRFMMANNFRYTCDVLDICTAQKVPLLYASSAATYGGSQVFSEDRAYEKPLNIYGYSKFLFDQVLRRRLAEKSLTSQVVGFRYFNVFGPNQDPNGVVQLFGGYDGYEAGEQKRDFVYIDDVVQVNLFFLDRPELSGIFNLGSGRAQTFNDVASSVINGLGGIGTVDYRDQSVAQLVAQGAIRYIDFPEALKGKYQSFTQASLERLRAVGYAQPFHTVEEGVGKYMQWLSDNTDFLAVQA